MDLQGEDLFQDRPGGLDSDDDVLNADDANAVEGLFRDDDDADQDDGIALGGEAESARMDLGEDPKTADVKKRVVRNPQPKLDLARISGPRGLGVLEEAFENFQPRGKGREFDDLDVVLNKMEHWAHRLYPKLPFDDVMDRISQLGKKMTVKTYLKRLRLGMDTNMSGTVDQDDDNENDKENEPRADRVQDPADSIFPPASPRRYDDPEDEFDEVANELERNRDRDEDEDEFERLAAEMEMEREAIAIPDAEDLNKSTQDEDAELQIDETQDKENVPQEGASHDSDDSL